MELTKEQILNADDIEIEKVDTPEWGGYVFVRSLSVEESYRFSRSNVGSDGKAIEKNLIVEYCIMVMCNSKGERLFTEEEFEKLSRKSTLPVMRIYEAGRKLNGEDIEELEKNLEQTLSEDSDLD